MLIVKSMIQRIKNSDNGATFVLMSFYVAVMAAVVALVVDLGNGFRTQRQIQFAADSGVLAGAQVFMDPVTYPQTTTPQQTAAKAAAISRGQSFASANGLPGATVIAGTWNSSTRVFTSDSDVGFVPPYNALRIPGVKQISTTFARVFGVSSLQPASNAISFAVAPSNDGCVKPLGVSTDAAFPSDPLQLSVPYSYTPPLTLTIGWNGEGNWGKIDLEGPDGQPINMSSGGNFFNYMGTGICGSTSTLNETPDAAPGSSSFCSALNQPAVLGKTIYMFLTDPFPNGSHPTTLERYVEGVINSCSGNGSHVTVSLTINKIVNTLPNSGNAIPGARSLVK